MVLVAIVKREKQIPHPPRGGGFGMTMLAPPEGAFGITTLCDYGVLVILLFVPMSW
jgi:hypothetical protein